MLNTRRKKKKGQKVLDRISKQAKKLGKQKQSVKTAGADAAGKAPS
jgi:hypothetical protein